MTVVTGRAERAELEGGARRLILDHAARLLRSPGLRGWGVLLGLLLCTQVGLGIANVMLSLPLHIAVLHNAGATALLFVLVTLLARLRAPEA